MSEGFCNEYRLIEMEEGPGGGALRRLSSSQTLPMFSD